MELVVENHLITIPIMYPCFSLLISRIMDHNYLLLSLISVHATTNAEIILVSYFVLYWRRSEHRYCLKSNFFLH